MARDKTDVSTIPPNLASLVRGLYGRVARKLDLDPSYVSRIARGERRSETVEATLHREMKRIMELATANHNGFNHNGLNHSGAGKRNTVRKGSKKGHR